MAGKNDETSGNSTGKGMRNTGGLLRWFWQRPLAVYIAVVLLILLPLLRPGYIFGVDMFFTPSLAMPADVTQSYLFYALLHVLDIVLPSMLIQKLLLFGTLLLAGIGAHTLVRYLRPAAADAKLWNWAAYFAGIFYLCNPFTYTRFMVGQYEVLLGYALLPLFVLLAWKFFRHPGFKQTAQLTVCVLAISIVSIHTLGMVLVLGMMLAGGFGWGGRRNYAWLLRAGKWVVLGLLTFVIASSYWLIPLIRGDSVTSDSISNFTAADRAAFETSPGELGLIGNVLALQGFWGDEENLYLLPQDTMVLWWVPIAALWFLIAAGLAWYWRQWRSMALFSVGLIALGLVLAIGTAGTIFAGFNTWLFDHVPFFAGYREPQKFAALIVLGYAFLGGAGVYWLSTRIRLPENRKFIASSLLLPLACAPLFIWGGAGQMQVADYPKGWYEANQLLQEKGAKNAKALFLPWHLYMPYHFSGDVLASPASRFFTNTTILSSRNPEMDTEAHSYTTNRDIQLLDEYILPDAADNNRLALDLNTFDIRYILLTKDFDYKDYTYLDSKPGIKLIHENTDIKIYAVEQIAGGS